VALSRQFKRQNSGVSATDCFAALARTTFWVNSNILNS
jgi:hypothetical protein